MEPEEVRVCPECEDAIEEGSEEPLYECGSCGEQFTRSNSSDGDSNRCSSCNKFAAYLYETHEGCTGNIEDAETKYQCPYCEERFPDEDTVSEHIEQEEKEDAEADPTKPRRGRIERGKAYEVLTVECPLGEEHVRAGPSFVEFHSREPKHVMVRIAYISGPYARYDRETKENRMDHFTWGQQNRYWLRDGIRKELDGTVVAREYIPGYKKWTDGVKTWTGYRGDAEGVREVIVPEHWDEIHLREFTSPESLSVWQRQVEAEVLEGKRACP